ncbi:unnamed protein product, partial [Meganyctiphanes norvegica]
MHEECNCQEPCSYFVFICVGEFKLLGPSMVTVKTLGQTVSGIKINTNEVVEMVLHTSLERLSWSNWDHDFNVEGSRAVNLNNISHPWTVISGGFNTPDGLAVDWVANNLYWTDAGRKVIEVAMVNGTNRMILISERLVEPRAIAVFPEKGMLFWTDWGGNNSNNNKSKIERSYLDGSERKILVNTDIGWPNGLTIDYKGERIYWNDANRDTIETSDLNGNNRAVLVRRVPRPFGLTQLGPYIYWTDWEKMSIERADKNSGKKKETIRSGIQGIMDIKAIASDVQRGNNPCSIQNGGCSHLCLYTPTGARCACPDIPTSKPCTKAWLGDYWGSSGAGRPRRAAE